MHAAGRQRGFRIVAAVLRLGFEAARPHCSAKAETANRDARQFLRSLPLHPAPTKMPAATRLSKRGPRQTRDRQSMRTLPACSAVAAAARSQQHEALRDLEQLSDRQLGGAGGDQRQERGGGDRHDRRSRDQEGRELLRRRIELGRIWNVRRRRLLRVASERSCCCRAARARPRARGAWRRSPRSKGCLLEAP